MGWRDWIETPADAERASATVAKVATVAVANPQKPEPSGPLGFRETGLIRLYLEGEGWDPQDVNVTIRDCQESEEIAGYYLPRAIAMHEKRMKIYADRGISYCPVMDPFTDMSEGKKP